jgi:two-component system response regulator MprA
MRILVIDDDRDIREIVVELLAAEGHEVAGAVDGAAAIDQLQRGARPSLIFLDMMMPRLDGEGFLKAMRSDPSLADIPVVILTAHPGAQLKATELGAAGCLRKPVEIDDLLATVERARPQAHGTA